MIYKLFQGLCFGSVSKGALTYSKPARGPNFLTYLQAAISPAPLTYLHPLDKTFLWPYLLTLISAEALTYNPENGQKSRGRSPAYVLTPHPQIPTIKGTENHTSYDVGRRQLHVLF